LLLLCDLLQTGTGANAKEGSAAAAAPVSTVAAAAATASSTAGEADVSMESDDSPPNNVLFLSGLPPGSDEVDTEAMLEMLFGPEAMLEGLQEVRLVSGRPDIAFVEYADAEQATAAKDRLQGFKITPENALAIIYAKK
jgi:U2 small nuclear ribonucleoprotein B''